MHQEHLVIRLDFNGFAREIRSTATIIDPNSAQQVELTKAIWDTGATNTTIRHDIAEFLGLSRMGFANVHTANGITLQPTYLIELKLPNNLTIKNLTVAGGDLGPETEMLIGMDLIAIGDFILQNDRGKTQFCFCWPPMKKKYNIWQAGNAENFRMRKKAKKR